MLLVVCVAFYGLRLVVSLAFPKVSSSFKSLSKKGIGKTEKVNESTTQNKGAVAVCVLQCFVGSVFCCFLCSRKLRVVSVFIEHCCF